MTPDQRLSTRGRICDVEDELAGVSAALGYPDVPIAASPAGVTLNLARGAASTFESVNGGLRLDQAADVRAIRHRLPLSTLTVSQASEASLDLPHRPPRYPEWLANLGWIAVATGIAPAQSLVRRSTRRNPPLIRTTASPSTIPTTNYSTAG